MAGLYGIPHDLHVVRRDFDDALFMQDPPSIAARELDPQWAHPGAHALGGRQ